MSGQGSPGEDEQTEPLSHDQLVGYVRDVMGWNSYQAEAYVAVVRNGPLEPNDLVATTNIPQGRVYDIMGTLEGEFVSVQGRQPKRYQAQHPRSILSEEQEEFNEKADAAKDHLEQQFEIQRERVDPRHPAWVIPGISGTKRELLEALEDAEEQVLLMERDGSWIQSNEIRDLGNMVTAGIDVEVVGWSGWHDTLARLAEEANVTAWEHERIDTSFGLIDDDLAVMRIGRNDTGIKVQDGGTVNVLRRAFEVFRQEATEVQPHA